VKAKDAAGNLNAGDLSIKTHRLTVFVKKGGIEYAKTLTFDITN
jgi:hypothetical protein